MPSPRPICFPNHHSSGPDCAPFVLSSSTNVSLVPPVLQAQGLDWVLPWPFPLCLSRVPRNLLETWAGPGSVSWLESSLRLWKNKISFQVNLLFQLLYLLVIQVLNSSTNTSLCVCVCVCVCLTAFTFFPYQINWLLDNFYIKTVLEKKMREEKKKLSFSSLTQPITWFPLTFVFIFFSQQKYLFFLLSILEIVSQGMTLMKGEASVLTRWMLLVDWLLLASTGENCGLSPLSGSSPLSEVWHWQRKRGPMLTPLLTHYVTWRCIASPLLFFVFFSTCKMRGQHIKLFSVDRSCS